MGLFDRLRGRRGPPHDGDRPAADGAGSGHAPDAAAQAAASQQVEARNAEIDRLFAYHARTRHSYASVSSSYRQLDWANQPNPFRRHAGAPRVELPDPARVPLTELPMAPTGEVLSALAGTGTRAWPEQALPLLSVLLHHSLAISAWKQVRDADVRWSLRVNPSSGNLHPTEAWLAVTGFADLPDGLWHYDVAGHALECRRTGPALAALAALCGKDGAGAGSDGPTRGVLVLLTSIFWREAWKYGERAYRYCLHDAGHAASAVAAAARALGLPAELRGHFADAEVVSAAALAPGDEQPLLCVDLCPAHEPAAARSIDLAAAREACAQLSAPAGEPNTLSPESWNFPLIEGLHASTGVAHGACPRAAREDEALPRGGETTESAAVPLPAPDVSREPFARAVRRRRSALDYDPTATCTLEQLSGLLAEAAVLPRADFLDSLGAGAAPNRLVVLYLYAHGVIGLPPGCYRYLPGRHALRCQRTGDMRRFAAGLSLGQELAGNSICTFSLVADLERGAAVFGNRAYRHAHVEAGLLGQGLYLAATARGFDATGIGAFFDEDVQRFLGLSGRGRQVIYHHSFGRAVLDERLVDADRPQDVRDDV